MTESYKELLVKKERGAKDTILRVISAVPTVLAVLLTLVTFNLLFLIITIGFGVLTYFVFQWTDIEYEYLLLEITIDKIMAKTRRKRVLSISVDKIEILAPVKSHQLDSFKSRQVKTVDYSAGADLPEEKQYAMYYDGSQKYLLNLTEDFVNAIKGVAPRKVFLD